MTDLAVIAVAAAAWLSIGYVAGWLDRAAIARRDRQNQTTAQAEDPS